MKFKLSILLLTSLAFALQKEGNEIPPYKGEDQHSQNQPQHCQNYRDSMFKANCSCQPMAGDEECGQDKNAEDYEDPREMPSRCKTACRRSACQCTSSCTS